MLEDGNVTVAQWEVKTATSIYAVNIWTVEPASEGFSRQRNKKKDSELVTEES